MKRQSIFHSYPQEYDVMTDAAAREPNHAREVETLVARFQPTRVLDAGCATGLTTRLFAERGIETVGLDCSGPILDVAKRRYADSRLPMSFLLGRFEKLPQALTGKFDLVACLANAIVGVDDAVGLRQALRSFHRVLKPGGALVIQALNFEVVKEGRLHPVKATVTDRLTYLRLLRRQGVRIELIAIRIDTALKPPVFEAFSHEFRGLRASEFEKALTGAGFGGIKRFGNLLLSTPFRRNSRDLVVTATRS